MTKELKQESEEYTETKGKERFRKFYNSDKNIAELITQVYMDSAEPREKRIAELEKENAELKADNDARKFAMAMSEKVEKQLREENAELRKVKRVKIEVTRDYKKLAKDLQEQGTQLTKAKEIITDLLNVFVYDLADDEMDTGHIDTKKEAEQFLKDQEEANGNYKG
jgi:hypothetical protein